MAKPRRKKDGADTGKKRRRMRKSVAARKATAAPIVPLETKSTP